MKCTVMVPEHVGEFRVANTHRILQHGLEHGLQLAGRSVAPSSQSLEHRCMKF
jgi:hypothetical protein